MRFLCWSRLGRCLLAAGLLNVAACAATWYPLGPFGGDARSLAADPADSRHLFLGTATGWIYDSHDGGEHWNRVAQLARRNDLVIDHIVVDRTNPKRLIVGAYTVDHLGDGGIFISEDYGKNWYSQAEMRGQSVRSLTRSGSDPRELVAGTLRGVFQSRDNGVHWRQISPEGSAEIKEVQSIAIDPDDPNVIYAGTWHLPWKTTDDGATWANIKQGIIDDSDVFSIIVDPKDPNVIYASACSGIYKSSNAGELFHKVQGIPSAARRTRTLEQDPKNLDVVFAGTTEGLYRTLDAGAHWDRLTPSDVIVNDVYVDPANPNHVLMATDRGGVYRSEDGGVTFESSNNGFSARQVTAYAADAQRPGMVYVGVVNDKTTGGVFASNDGGVRWQQQSEGLNGRDVFSLISLADGGLLAGTAHGVFRLEDGGWIDSSALEGETAKERVDATPKAAPILPVPTRLTSPAPRSGTSRAKARPAEAKKIFTRSSTHTAHGKSAQTAATRRSIKGGPRGGKAHLILVKSKSAAKTSARPAGTRAVGAPRTVASPQAVARGFVPAQVPADSQPERLDAVVYSFAHSGDSLFTGTASGLLRSTDLGRHWAAVNSLSMPDVHYVATLAGKTEAGTGGSMVFAGNLQRLALSPDGGVTWDTVALPADLTQIGALAIDGDRNLWVGGREGVWMSTDYGATWKTLHNLFLTEVDSIFFDAGSKRMLVTTSASPVAFSVAVPDHKVTYWNTGWKLRFVRPVGDHLIGATLFDGVVVQPKMVASPEVAEAGGGK